MKKFLLLLALVAMGAMWSSVEARWNVGDRKTAYDIKPGDTIVIEQSSNDKYLGWFIQATSSKLGVQLQEGLGIGDAAIIVVEEGPNDVRTGASTVYLRMLETNKYIGTNTAWADGCGVVSDPSQAANFQLLSCAEDIPWANMVAWTGGRMEGHEGDEKDINNWTTLTNGGSRGSDDQSVGFSYSQNEKDYKYLAFWYSQAPNIILWNYCDTQQWNVYAVSYEKSLQDDLQAMIDLYTGDPSVEFIAGTDPGYYQEAAVDAYNTALEEAMLLSLTAGLPDEDYQNAMDNLKAARAAVEASAIGITEGYYYMVSGYQDFLDEFGIEKAAYIDDNAGVLKYRTFDADNLDFVFKVTPNDAQDEFWVQSYGNDYYVACGTAWYNSTPACTPTQDEPQNIRQRFAGLWYWGSKTWHNTSYTPYAASTPKASDSEGNVTSWGTWTDPCTVENHSNLWNIRKVSDEKMAEFKVMKAQSDRDNELAELVKQANALYGNLFAYTTDYDNPLITNCSGGATEEPGEGNQIVFSTIRKQGIETSDKYEFLIDEDPATYMQGSGYLRINLNEPKQNLTFVYQTRGGSDKQKGWGLDERPKLVNLYGANTLEGDTVFGPAVHKGIDMSAIDVNDTETLKSMPVTVDMGRPVNRIAYQVDLNYNGGTYFTLGGFQIYEAKVDETTSQYYTTPGLKEAADAMKTAATEKNAIVAAGTTTTEDIAEMQAAIKAVKALYADTVALAELIEEAEGLLAVVEEGEGMGQLADGELATALGTAIAEARENAFVVPINVAAVQAATAAVTEALAAFKAGIKTVEPGKWYFITNLDDKRAGEKGADDAFCNGNAIYLNSVHTSGSITKWGLFDEGSMSLNADNNPAAMWTFDPIAGTEYFAIRNMYTGYYLGDFAGENINLPVSETQIPYEVKYIGGGQFTLTPKTSANKNNFSLWPEGAQNDVVCHQFDGSTSAWTFIEIDPEEQEAISIPDFAMNLMDIMAVPYNVSNLADYNDDVHTYAIKKITQEEAEDGTYNTTIEFYEKDEFAAGEPFLIGLGDFMNEEAEFEDYDLLIPFPTEFIDHNVEMVANGIVGGLHSLKFDHVTSVSNGHAWNPMAAGGGFGAQTGVFDVLTYKGEVKDVETALTLELTGLPKLPEAGTGADVNGDGQINAADVVSVYNFIIDGEESGVTEKAADVNGDGQVNAADVVAIYNEIIGAAGSRRFRK